MKSNAKKNKKINKKILVSCAVLLIAVIIVVTIVVNAVKGGAKTKTQINEEVWIEANQSIQLKNNGEKVELTINSPLDYKEDSTEEFPVNYTLKVNDAEYTGIYTFAQGYSIHSEPNAIPYKVNFVGIKDGSVCVKITEKEVK